MAVSALGPLLQNMTVDGIVVLDNGSLQTCTSIPRQRGTNCTLEMTFGSKLNYRDLNEVDTTVSTSRSFSYVAYESTDIYRCIGVVIKLTKKVGTILSYLAIRHPRFQMRVCFLCIGFVKCEPFDAKVNITLTTCQY